ncbi:hypothetical protein [Streptomyces sp. SID3343]|uniref:hypothetical protein n=1 Tax=Streptomyces sp. SID3343 TaxID=2690260 RepID=UPI00136BF7C0|nr:hypothetical protein [Streptomyces sp. SID3343]MYW05970.1 hypothetical protein [Streptomyces sp. SID3343]
MSCRRIALRFVVALSLAAGMTGVVQSEAGAGAGAGTETGAEARTVACPPPGGGACYFSWIDKGGVSHRDNNPDTYYCYQAPETVAGSNHTNRRVYLYADRDCVGNAVKYVDPGLSWRDNSTVLWSYDFVGP